MGAGAVLEAPASVPNAGALVATGYSIDSRTVAPGDLFFAVRGERHDGHDFVAAAFERGAVAALVSRERVATLPDAALARPLLIAEDPLAAMQSLASHVRRQWGRRRRGHHRLGRQNHHQGSRSRGPRRKVSRPQIRRQSEQQLRPALATAAPHAGTRVRRCRDGHESLGRDRRAGAHRRSRLGRDHQRGHGAH